MAATRFSATPPHKNTFLNFQANNEQSAMFISEQDRFQKTHLSKTLF